MDTRVMGGGGDTVQRQHAGVGCADGHPGKISHNHTSHFARDRRHREWLGSGLRRREAPASRGGPTITSVTLTRIGRVYKGYSQPNLGSATDGMQVSEALMDT